MNLMAIILVIVIIQFIFIFFLAALVAKIMSDVSYIRGAFISSVVEKLNKLEQIGLATMKASETFVDALENAMKDGVMPHSAAMHQVFRTADGKHMAHSIEDFIKKLEADPEYQNLAEKIKTDLENAINSSDEDINFEDDEEDDEQEFPEKF